MGNQNNNPTTHQTAKAALTEGLNILQYWNFPCVCKIKIAPQTDQITPHNFDQGIPVVR